MKTRKFHFSFILGADATVTGTEFMQKIPYQKIEQSDDAAGDPEEFIDRCLEPGIPCLLDGLSEGRPAHWKWTKSYFENEMGDLSVRYHKIVAEDQVEFYQEHLEEMALSEFITRLDQGEAIKFRGFFGKEVHEGV